MKKIKITLSLIVIFIGLIFVGELNIFYLENFANDLPNTTIIYQQGLNHQKMKDEVLESAKNNNVDFFVIKHDIVSTSEKNLIIYQSDPAIKNFLSKEKGVNSKEYKSIFFGKVNVKFDDYKNISDSDLEVNNNYFVLGSHKDIKNFKLSLIDKYAGNHPIFPEVRNSYDYTIYGLWIVIFGLCLIFTAIYVKTRKKDVFIKTMYGESRLYIILKESLIDLFSICGLAILIQQILKTYTNTEFYKGTFYLMLGIFALLNFLMYLPFYKIQVGKIYKDKSKLTLTALYLLKTISVILVSLFIAMNVVMVKEAVEFISQENFFKEHKEYYYTNIGYIPRENANSEAQFDIEDNARIKEIFYLKNFKDFEPMILANFAEYDNDEMVLANANSIDYIKSQIKSLKENKFSDKLYYLVPEDKKGKQDLDSLDLRLQNYFDENEVKEKQVIYYDDNAKIIAIDDLLPLNSKISKNPIIILDNSKPHFNEENIKGNPFKTTYDRDIMYKIDEDKFDDFINEYNLESEIHGKSNAYDTFMEGKLKMQRLLKMSIVISLILIVLEFIIITTLIKLEFRMNAYSISIKKILGYNIWERYKRLLLFPLIGSIIAVITFSIINYNFNLVPYTYGISIIAIIFIIEQILIRYEIRKIENHNIQLVLKGEFR